MPAALISEPSTSKRVYVRLGINVKACETPELLPVDGDEIGPVTGSIHQPVESSPTFIVQSAERLLI